jgi:hypothetical protein
MSSKQNNPLSKKAQRKSDKNSSKNSKNVKFDDPHSTYKSDSDVESPDEAASVAGRKQAAASQAGSSTSAKRTKTSADNTMEVDFDLNISSKNFSTSAEKTKNQLTPEIDQRQPQPNLDVEQISTSGKSYTTTIADHGNQSVDKDTSNKNSLSRHAKSTNDDDETMFVDIDDVTRPKYRAAVPIRHVIKDKESRKTLRNRLNDYFVSDFTSFKECYLRGNIETGLTVAIFFEESERNGVISDKHPKLQLDN